MVPPFLFRRPVASDRRRPRRLGVAAVALLAVALLLVTVIPAGQGDRQAPVAAGPAHDPADRAARTRPVIRMGYTEQAPYSSTGPAGVARGFSIDLMVAIAESAGYDLRFVATGTPAAAVEALLRGQIDATTLIAVTPGRAARIAFTSAVVPMDISLIVRTAETRFASAEGLRGMRIGVVAGTVAEDVARGLDGVEIVPHDAIGAMAMALLEGDVDALVSPQFSIRRTAVRAGIPDRFRVLGTPLARVDLAFALPRGRPGLRARFDAAIAALRASGQVGALADAWFGSPWSLWRDARAAWSVAGAGWLAALVSLLASVAAARSARRRAREEVARATFDRDRLAAAHEDLARSNARLEQANEQLERFTFVAAHDLRAPLRALMTLPGWVREELADAGVRLPDEVPGLLDDMFDQAASMDRMLKDLLDYARLGAGTAERTRFSPADRIRDVARMAGMPDEFTLEIAPDMPELELSIVEFDTVMRNLLSNAVKHHDEAEGRIVVRGWRQDGAAVLEVEDDGPGIAPEHRERVFEIFSTLGGRERAGGGMGLAFVRRIVESWGGEVTIRAPDDGRGAVFRLTVPAPVEMSQAA